MRFKLIGGGEAEPLPIDGEYGDMTDAEIESAWYWQSWTGKGYVDISVYALNTTDETRYIYAAAAVYDGDYNIIGIGCQKLTVDNSLNASFEVPCGTGTADHVRVFFFGGNDGVTPLCDDISEAVSE
jgi:hypothetical protein